MKKLFTYVPINKALSTLSAKIFLIALLFCGNSFEGFATAWTTSTAGPITTLTNWTNGTTSPTNFTTPGDTWTITLAMTITSASSWTVGTTASTASLVTFASGGSLTNSEAGTSTSIITIYGNVINNGGTISNGGSGTTNATFNIYGNYSMTAGSVTESASGFGVLTLNVYGNYTMTGGTTSISASGTCSLAINVYGNFSMSGACAMTNGSSASGCTSTVYLSLPTTSGTMLIDNTSTGAWSGTNIYIRAHCTAQLDGNFLSTTGTATYGLTDSGTLICPAIYAVNGAGIFTVEPAATLEVANAAGINGNITTTGTIGLNPSANYVFNGTVAQVTGSYMLMTLTSPDTITISNSAGVTLSQNVATHGTLLFTSGILYTTAAYTITTPGAAGAVVGAGATSYVDGTLVKIIPGYTSVNFEVGDIDYAPMNLIFSATGTGGSLGVMSTNGLHPMVGTSGILTTNIVNHYWTITNYSAAGPATITPKATYNLSDIIGGSNTSFVTQEYTSAWLGSAITSTNTTAPYTSVPNTGIALGTLAGAYIYGNDCGTPILGATSICTIGSTTTLSDATASGTWSSGSASVATVSASGVVTAVSAGTATIFYNTASCSMSAVITVGTPPITGATPVSVCPGSTTTLSDATTGGVWSSSNTTIATVSATGVVYGIATGSASISYTLGSCAPVGIAVTVATVGAITPATATVCAGSVTSLSDATSGGVWSSSSTTIATVSGTGVVTGIAAGTTTIVYTSGGCSESATVTVSGTLAVITGATAVCAGSTIHLSDATTGGVWSSSNTTFATVSATGVVTGVSAGTTDISYATGSCSVGVAVTVGSAIGAITPATATVCAGSVTSLSDATSGGVWSSSSTTIATVSGTGVVTGIAAGTTTIVYTSGGCSESATVTVSGTLAAITGATAVCAGSTIHLSDATAGGVWSSSNTAVATVSGTGVVTGVSSGTANITYTSGGCTVDVAVTVSGPLSAITGGATVCAGSTITLSASPAGGVWSSSSTTIATVSGTGVVTGGSPGTVTIIYTLGSCSESTTVTVGNALSPITGTVEFCVTSSTSLSDATAGGVWSSGNTVIATVSGTVVVHGVSAGTATISYTAGGCSVTYIVTVDPNNGGTITGRDTVCTGTPGTLSDSEPGGVWSSGNTSLATVNASTGAVYGVASGTVTISYIVTNTCGTYTVTTVMHVFTATHCPLGIEPVAENQGAELKVFPNPNTGTFTMNLASDNNEEVHVVITNIVGEKVSEFITATNTKTDIKLVPAAGIYLLSASTADGRYVAKVVVY